MFLRPCLIALLLFRCAPERTEEKELNSDKRSIQNLVESSRDKSMAIEDRLRLIDSAYYISKKSALDSLHLVILSAKSVLHLRNEQPDNFFIHNQLLARHARTLENHYFLGKAQFNIGYYYEESLGQTDSAFHYYQNSKNSYLKLNDSIQVGRRFLGMAMIQKNQNDFFGAKETLTQALLYLERSEDDRFLASVYNELATNHMKLQNYSDALVNYRYAIEVAHSKEDQIIYTNNLSLVHAEIDDFSEAISTLESIAEDTLLKVSKKQHARVLDNLIYAKWRNGENIKVFEFLNPLEIRKKANDKRGQIASYTHLGEYFSKTNPKTASRYLDSVIQLSKKLKIPRAETDALKLLMQLEPKNTVFKDRYIFLKDSLYQQELKVKTQFAKMRYDDQQEKEQILRLEAETLQKQAELAEAKTQQVLFLSLSGLLVIAGTSLYYLLRQRHRKEKLREVYRTEKMISQRLHDELSNDIFGLMANVEQHPDENTPYLLDGLEKIYQHTRTISHDTREIALGDAFPTELKDELGSFYNTETAVIVKGLEDISWEKLSDEKCIAVHRGLKELLVNMRKHSQASLVAIRFEERKKVLRITYTDNGIGMDPEPKFGVGLKNTVSRIQGVQGKINFDSDMGKGTQISIEIPF